MQWQQGMPNKSGLYWLLIKTPVDFIQPILFYATTNTHDAIYTTNVGWYDSDSDGNIVIDERLYDSSDSLPVCTQDKENTYWMRIPQPDTNVSR